MAQKDEFAEKVKDIVGLKYKPHVKFLTDSLCNSGLALSIILTYFKTPCSNIVNKNVDKFNKKTWIIVHKNVDKTYCGDIIELQSHDEGSLC